MPRLLSYVARIGQSIILSAVGLVTLTSTPLAMAATTGETPEIVYTGTSAWVKTVADTLTTPVAIYEYVHNSIEYSPYHGSRSGSVNTLLGMRGSDVDIATLLIAMLRSQNLASRYAVGTIRVPAAQVTNWLGVTNLDAAIQILRDQGIQNITLATDRSTVDFEHTWAEVYVPFDQYRGVDSVTPTVDCTIAANASRCTWIPLDASFKQKTYNGLNIDPYNAVTFDYSGYYNALKNSLADPTKRDKNPLTILEDQIAVWLRTSNPGKTLEDVMDRGKINEVNEGLLPASLPYQVISSIRRYDSVALHDAVVPASEPKKWGKRLTIQTQWTNNGSTVTANAGSYLLAQIDTQRLSLSTEFVGSVPNMVMRLDGVEASRPIQTITGHTPALGNSISILLSMDGAPGYISSVADQVIAPTYTGAIGGYYLMATGGETSNWSQVHRAADQLLGDLSNYPIVLNPSDPGVVLNGTTYPCDLQTGMNCTPYVDYNGNGWDSSDSPLLYDQAAQEALTGGLLSVAANQYYVKFREKIDRADHLMKTKTPIRGFLGVVSSTFEAEYINGTAFSILPGGLLIDMKGIAFGGSYRVNDPTLTYSNREFEFLGHIGSSLEHETWQELTGYDAVSTVRGLQMALNAGASLVDAVRNQSTSTIPQALNSLGFIATAPTPFQVQQLDIYGTRPTIWTHPTQDGTVQFEALKNNLVNFSDSRSGLFTYNNGTWTPLIQCYDSTENTLNSFLATYGGNQTLGAGSLCYDYASGATVTYPQGTTINQAISMNQTAYQHLRAANTDSFNYLDVLQGFNLTDFGFRTTAPAAGSYSTDLIQSIRDDLLFRDTSQSWLDYVLPSLRVTASQNDFDVYIRKGYLTPGNQLTTLTFKIANYAHSAGGGFVSLREPIRQLTEGQ